jgi:hypothetical protein
LRVSDLKLVKCDVGGFLCVMLTLAMPVARGGTAGVLRHGGGARVRGVCAGGAGQLLRAARAALAPRPRAAAARALPAHAA